MATSNHQTRTQRAIQLANAFTQWAHQQHHKLLKHTCAVLNVPVSTWHSTWHSTQHCQPLISITNSSLIHCRALRRWAAHVNVCVCACVTAATSCVPAKAVDTTTTAAAPAASTTMAAPTSYLPSDTHCARLARFSRVSSTWAQRCVCRGGGGGAERVRGGRWRQHDHQQQAWDTCALVCMPRTILKLVFWLFPCSPSLTNVAIPQCLPVLYPLSFHEPLVDPTQTHSLLRNFSPVIHLPPPPFASTTPPTPHTPC